MYDRATNVTNNKVNTSIKFMGILLLVWTRGHLTSENRIQLSIQLYSKIIAQNEQMFKCSFRAIRLIVVMLKFRLSLVYANAFSNFSIPILILLILSSLPSISAISKAPPGVICFPDTAVLRGQRAVPFLIPLLATYSIQMS